MAAIIFGKLVSIFIMLGIGYLCRKTEIIDTNTKDKLSKLSTQIVNPLLVLVSFQIEYDVRLLKNMGIAFVLAVAAHLFAIVCSKVLLREKEGFDHVVERISVIYSNCGFMGIPLVSAIFGSEGVVYATTFITVFHMFMWTQGIRLFQSDEPFSLKKLINPSIVCVAAGLLCFALQIKIPESPMFALSSVANMNTPLAMLVSGAVIGEIHIKEMLVKPRLYVITVFRMILLPVAFCLFLKILPVDTVVKTVIGILASCPSAAMGIMLSVIYGRDDAYGAEIFTFTTLISIITMPLCMMILR